MRIEETYIPDARGEMSLHTVIWYPDKNPIGVLQIVHGMQEYVMRYDEMAKHFCENGYIVCGADHLGHGLSLIDGHRGYFGESDTTAALVENVHAVRLATEKRFPSLPYFIFAHSMGSFISRLYITRYSASLSGIIISGTAGPNPAARLLKPILYAMWRVHGGTYVNKKLAGAIADMYDKSFRDEKVRNAWLSSNLTVAEKYNKDPQTQFDFSVSALWTLMDMLGGISKRSWVTKVPADLPILLTSGANDPVGGFGEGVRTVYDRLMYSGHTDVSINLYLDCRHELHNEKNRAEVFADWLSWLDEHRT